MRAVVLFILAAAVCIGVSWWVAALPGHVAMVIAGTTLEAGTPVALTLVAGLFVVLYLVIRVLLGIVRLPRTLGRMRRERNRNRGDSAVNRTLVALAAHDPALARREAERSRRLLGDTPLTLLLAAQAGRQGGREAEAGEIFQLLADTKGGQLLGLRGLLRQAIAAQDWESAERTLALAEAAHPGAAWLAEERQRIAVQTGKWREALSAPTPRRGAVAVSDGDSGGMDKGSRAAFAVAAAEAETDPAAGLRLAKQAWEADPALAPAALHYATRLRQGGRERAALDVLRRGWALAPQPDLVSAYLAPVSDRMGRLRAAQELAGSNPAHGETGLMLAQVALEAGLTGEARQYAGLARDAGLEDRRLWVLLGAVAEHDGDAAAGQEALRALAAAKPGPSWRCAHCGTVHEAWHPVCDVCGTAGRIAWTASDAGGSPRPVVGPTAIAGFG